MPVLTYAFPDFTAYTKIKSAEVNSKFTSIATVLNGSNILPRTILENGTASHVIINNGSGVMSSEAQLAKSRGGTGYDLTTQPLELPEISTPSTPASGFGRIYYKTDGYLYQLNDAGTETRVGAGSSSGINYIESNPDAESGVSGWSTYSDSQTATITIANPAVITVASTTGFYVGLPVVFTTTGALPTGISPSTVYYVSEVTSATTFKISATLGGANVETTGSQSGVHSAGPTRALDGTGGTATATFTRTTTNPLRGTGSFLLTPGKVGDGVSFAFTISAADKAKILSISFDYALSNTITDGDFKVSIYDVTNSRVIEPSGTSIANISSSLTGKYQSTFQSSSDSTSYRLTVHQSAVTSVTLKMDNVIVGPQTLLYGAPITDWATWTPTGSWSANTTYTGRRRRVGDTEQFQLKIALSGAPTSAALTINLPVTIDTTKLTNTATGENVLGQGTIHDDGTDNYADVFAVYSAATQVTLYSGVVSATSATAPQLALRAVSETAPITFAANDTITLEFSVPVAGYGSSVVMSSDADTRVVSAVYQTAAGQSIDNGTPEIVDYGTKVFDTHNSVTTGASWKYTAPVAGKYRVSASVRYASAAFTAGADIAISLYKNGSSYGVLDIERCAGFTDFPGLLSGSVIVDLSPGDYIDIRAEHEESAGRALQNVASLNMVSIDRIAGPATIAASEFIAARYTRSSAQNIPNNTDTILDYPTKGYDTHGAVTTGASWKFTAPQAGYYKLKASVAWSTVSPTANYAIKFFKNGVLYSRWAGEGDIYVFAHDDTVQLNVGDYIDVRVIQVSGGALDTDTAPETQFVAIERIS